MRQSKPKTINKKKILLICEGEYTEPSFFDELMNFCIKDKVLQTWIDYQYSKDTSLCNVRIDPMPPHVKENLTNEIRGKSASSKKKKVNTEFPEQQKLLREDKDTPQPLNWVIRGIRNKDMFSDVWCVFDNDERNYHGLEQAFDEAKKHNINIAYSNRCIEYFFLQYFEYKYLAFEKCECRDKNIRKSCKTDNDGKCFMSNDEHYKGKTCINGYARLKNYWLKSKSDNDVDGSKSLFNTLSNRLMFGAYNSVLIRQNVNSKFPCGTPIWKFNPYTDAEKLVLRLMGIYELERNNSLVFIDGNVETRIINNENNIYFEMIQGSLSAINIFSIDKNNFHITPSSNIRLTQATPTATKDKDSDKVTVIQINGKTQGMIFDTNKIACI